MALGFNVVLLYLGGAIGLGIIALVYTVRTKNQAKANRERLRRLRRILETAR